MKAIIEKAKDGSFGIYAQDEKIPLTAMGITEREARESFEEFYYEQADYIKGKTGVYPEWYKENEEFEYLYDMSAFFLAFPFINVTGFAKFVGINPSLMRKYKSGIVKAGEKQKDNIQKKYDFILNQLNAVRF